MTKRDALTQLEQELDKLLQTSSNEEERVFESNEMSRFASLFGRFLQEEGPSVEWDRMQKLPTEAVKDYATLTTPNEINVSLKQILFEHIHFELMLIEIFIEILFPFYQTIRDYLNKLVVIKLNGGLGTSMGCHGPKSVIPVRSDLTFLDLTVQQIEVSGFGVDGRGQRSFRIY